jgi:hypothetical protein
MKNLLFVLIAAASFAACNMADKKAGELSDGERNKALKDSANFTSIQWLDSTSRDLPAAKEGAKLEINYHFKNTGNHNLILSDVTASCGCTIPDWPKYPVAPGREDVIKAVFNSDGKQGSNHKEIHVLANTLPQSSMTLSFSVQINK